MPDLPAEPASPEATAPTPARSVAQVYGKPLHGSHAPPWQVSVGPSRRLAAAIMGGHLVAVAAVAVAGLTLPLALCLAVAILASGWFHVARSAWLCHPRSIVRLHIDGDGAVLAHCRDGRMASGTLDLSTVVGCSLTMVRLRLHGARGVRSVPLLADNCNAAAFRRLRTGLAWYAGLAVRH